MKNKDHKTAKVDLAGAASVISTMYALGFDDDTDENAFWEKRAILEKHEDAVRAAERERCCQLVYGHAASYDVAERTVRAIRANS